MITRYIILVTGPPYGTQQSSSAYLFAKTILFMKCCQLDSIFFYREGTTNANYFLSLPHDEHNLVLYWKELSEKFDVKLNICISSALKRGIFNKKNHVNQYKKDIKTNVIQGFQLSGLTTLFKSMLHCDRMVQF
ncbi:sulfurtransferase complex subunit TusD [Candidatus Tachikawaea gelatinosa]|uniref:Sulfurtransferase TusD n=1 Tax=Candidatus Tachikawaea gelatinosa TaxID=1410383 RepID=A0A090AJF3_9ENTR|nr:sulfurtransferase complex subunit TusD [Candidatus Tachikawaea gelatinosa]BAP58573.1 sulfurtransferase TusD [Candidatus Tachikawaea gelatinosa]